MTTPRTRPIVSLAIALSVTLSLAACARHSATAAPGATDWSAAVPERHRAVRFDNEAWEPVYVYLVGQRREWPLGRVEAGARTTLQIPVAAMDEAEGFTRIAVIAGTPSVRASIDPRSSFTIAQPTGSILSQRWIYSQQRAAREIMGMRAVSGRP